jgi:hypothetical protein
MSKVVIFDWDDTFLPSTELYNLMQVQGCTAIDCKLNPKQLEDMRNIDKLCLELLERIIKSRIDIVVVTNAENGWIEATAPVFLPLIYNFLVDSCTPVISAASLYKSKKSSTIEWKYYTFLDFFESSPTTYKEMISIGDSLCEKQATLWIEEYRGEISILPNVYSTIKMVDKPTTSKILEQFVNIGSILKNKYNL